MICLFNITIDPLDRAARRVLGQSPEFIRDAREHPWCSEAGAALAQQYTIPRWSAEHYVKRAIESLDARMLGVAP